MNYHNPIFLIPITIGPIFILSGILMLVFPPKKINWFYGYRTSRSMKNQDRWDFAQKYAAKELIKFGGLLSLTSVIGFIYEPDETIGNYIGTGLLISIVITLIIRVEYAIKSKFGKV